MATAIKVENLSKAYQLGEIGTGTLSRDIERWFAKVRGKEDPFLKIGETNDRTSKGSSDIVWSLKDINFDIQQGDAVGIIGRNGAGKSTLLKLLSRITSPTTGTIKVKGRIASLLEVGTGFHPELTGKENIYLNGAILGMRKKEITRKFDEIVEFAGVERYIGTPVKRYSSGMYVRLAFAVAAHLESEILIVDEVLAVGDAEFQNKCLGKMNEVSKGEGRTVLFVSHNLTSIRNLCISGLFLKNGMLQQTGEMEKVIEQYTMSERKGQAVSVGDIKSRIGNGSLRFTDISFFDRNNESKREFVIGESLEIKVFFTCSEEFAQSRVSRIDLDIVNSLNSRAAWLSSSVYYSKVDCSKGYISFVVNKVLLAEGSYKINLYAESSLGIGDFIKDVASLSFLFKDFYKTGFDMKLQELSAITEFSIGH